MEHKIRHTWPWLLVCVNAACELQGPDDLSDRAVVLNINSEDITTKGYTRKTVSTACNPCDDELRAENHSLRTHHPPPKKRRL